MSIITISKRKIDKQKGVVILSLEEYEKLRKQAVPTYYLSGRAAQNLDKLVVEGLREYRVGNTKSIRSLADLD